MYLLKKVILREVYQTPRGGASHHHVTYKILPADAAFDFETETFNGTIESDFEIKVTGKISPKEMRGVVNGGGASVKLSSFSGDIKLRKG